MKNLQYDVLIIGSGAAGLTVALSLANHYQVALISKEDILASSSKQAQGGIAAVISETDSFDAHIQDTLIAGDGLCDPHVVRFTIERAKPAIEWLIEQGVEFTRDVTERLHLGKEGGHSHRRIVHAADHTGAAIIRPLAEQVKAHPHIDCFPNHIAIDLIVDNKHCYGAHVFHNNQIKTFLVKKTILACGGASKIYLHTTHLGDNYGDGIAMAERAGALINHMEFNQFHPTCFYGLDYPPFLITEALRGEGAKLILENGERFMHQYHPKLELAPRDIVARAIHSELKKNNLVHVYLDATHLSSSLLINSFPTIYENCLQRQIDIRQNPIPVVPAAHYTCGGVVTNLNGETNLLNLYAIGETASTGLHGANRLASNSLLECIVFAASAAQSIRAEFKINFLPPNYSFPHFPGTKEKASEIQNWIMRIRTLLWDKVGIVRNNRDLLDAAQTLSLWKLEIKTLLQTAKMSKTLLELRNLIDVAELTTNAAINRRESRGLHFNETLKT